MPPQSPDPWGVAKVEPITPATAGADPWGIAKVEPRVPGAATIGEQLAAKALAAVNAFGEGTAEVATGAAKGVGNTLFGLGKLVRDYTPIGRVSDLISPGAFDAPPPELQPKGALQNLGFGGEQIAEFFIPVAKAGKVGKAAELAKTALLTQAQTDSPGTTAVATGLTAVTPPVVRAAARLAPGLQAGAEKTIAQALGATTLRLKREAAKLAPQVLARGVSGSREAVLARANAQVGTIGQAIDREIAAQAAAGATVDGTALRAAVQLAAKELHVPNAAGKLIPIHGTEEAIRELLKLDAFAKKMGPRIPFEHAQTIKKTWGHIVDKANLYGSKANATPTDEAAASALREGASALRQVLASGSPKLDALNKDYGFWAGLQEVLEATVDRTQAQSGGLTAAITGGAGVVAGAASGDTLSDRLQNAAIGGFMGRQLVNAVRSPWFRTTAAAPLKNALAAALAKGDRGQLQLVAARIIASMPSELRNATEP